MDHTPVFPTLSENDIQHAVTLITASFSGHFSIEEQRQNQWNLFEVQRRYEAWGLVQPLLDHPDPNVQFFGVQTAQVKIVRDWDTFPKERAVELKDTILELTGKAIVNGKSKVVLRKLFIALVHLALKLHPTRPSQWPDWILSTIAYLSGCGATPTHLLEFLSIVPEELRTSDLLDSTRMTMNESLLESLPMVAQAATTSITDPNRPNAELTAALSCLEKWIAWNMPANYLTPIIPILISLLSFERSFVPASEALQEIMTSSSLADGSGSKTLTEPLLEYFAANGQAVYEQAVANGVDADAHSFCKLVCALGDHSVNYFANHLSDPNVQSFVRLILNFTGLPGWYGVDEDESEACMQFWYLLQEGLWTVDCSNPVGYGDGWDRTEGQHWVFAAEIYKEVAEVLRRKVTWPKREALRGWTKDQIQKFEGYRRDVGDIMLNTYFVLREKMLARNVNLLSEALANGPPSEGWEDVEAALFCIMSVQEAVPADGKEGRWELTELFGPTVLGRLPTSGSERVRRTAIQLIGTYSSWFTAGRNSHLVMDAISYVATGLNDHSLALRAANAFKDLCDANRSALAQHITVFGNLYVGLGSVPESERGKVIQSIASVVQALPIEEAIQPVEVIVSPIVTKLTEAIMSAGQLPEDARSLCLQELRALTGCARGLTNSSESMFAWDQEAEQAHLLKMNTARDDTRMVKLRNDILMGLNQAVQIWSTDIEMADAFSDLFKSITCLPVDATLISLPPGPLLELVIGASRRQLISVWLSLAGMLIGQLDPPSFTTLCNGPTPEAENLMLILLPALLEPCFQFFNSTQAMENSPDIAQAFFSCLDTATHHFTRTLYHLPEPVFTALMQTAIAALAVQERYAFVAACSCLAVLFRQTFADGNLTQQADMLMNIHGRPVLVALLTGLASVTPRSALPNLIDLISLLALKRSEQVKQWTREILFSDYFVQTQASAEAKESFCKAIASGRSTKRIRDAANQFALIARGLAGTSFGYATVST